eukprot:4306086-Amphidinium_carterae.1
MSFEAAAARAGRSGCRVLGLTAARHRSVYGLHLDDAFFLQVEVSNPRDVAPLAAAVQSGDIMEVGQAQVFEAHLPFMLQFLAEHHLGGAGWVHVS